MGNENEKLNSWDNFTSGNFLKALDVNSENDAFVCIAIETTEVGEQGNKKDALRATLERNGKEYDFDLNKTNAKKLKELGLESPKKLIGKKIFFKKALVRNPKTNVEVEGLRIFKIE